MPTTPYNATKLAGDTWIVPGLTYSGWVDGLVIDTCDDDAPFALTSVDSVAISHGHADHFSIAHALREGGARVYVARDDAALVENPDINIRGMFSWARPGDLFVTRLFKGVPCAVDGYLEEWRDDRAVALPLPGHTLGHSGFLTRDGVLFSGDALYIDELWERHPLPYCIDPGMVVASLERIRRTECEWVVPGHGRPIWREDVERHVDFHLREIRRIEEILLEGLSEPRTTEQAIAHVSSARGLPENPASYWLAVTTVKGFLGELLGRGALEFFVQGHAGWWRAV